MVPGPLAKKLEVWGSDSLWLPEHSLLRPSGCQSRPSAILSQTPMVRLPPPRQTYRSALPESIRAS